jgi:hypothetical protein
MRTEVGWCSTLMRASHQLTTYPTMFKHLVPVNYSSGTPGDFVASGSSLLLPRAAADTRSIVHCTTVYSTPCYARAAEGGAGEEERRRDEGTGDRAKEFARTAGGKAAGVWVRRRATEERM